MKRYAKLIDGKLNYSPNKLVVGDTVVYNPSEVLLRSNGYKELIPIQVPQIEWNESLQTTYTEVNDKIIKDYVVVKREVSDEEIDDTAMAQEAFTLVEQAKSRNKIRYPKASD